MDSLRLSLQNFDFSPTIPSTFFRENEKIDFGVLPAFLEVKMSEIKELSTVFGEGQCSAKKGEKRGKPSGNPLGKNPSDFWDFLKSEFESGIFDFPNVKSNHPEKEAHPCQFPVELVERYVLAFTNEGGHVLDPFAGVGITAVASLKNSRNSVLIEISTDYCNIARQRIKKFLDDFLKLRPVGKQIHKPKPTDKLVQIPAEWIE